MSVLRFGGVARWRVGVATLVLAVVGSGGVLASGVAQSPEGSASSGPVVRVAEGVTVSRPYGETGRDDWSGFAGKPGFSRYRLPRTWGPYVVLGPDGALWSVDEDGYVTRFDTKTKRTRRFDTGGSTGGLVVGNDGRIYVSVADYGGSLVTVMTPEGKKIRDVRVPYGIRWLEAAAGGVWFVSDENANLKDGARYTAGVIRPNGRVERTPDALREVGSDGVMGQAVARLSNGEIAVVGASVWRGTSPANLRLDPMFQDFPGPGRDNWAPTSVLAGLGPELRVLPSLPPGGGDTLYASDGASRTTQTLIRVPNNAVQPDYDPNNWRGEWRIVSLVYGPDGKMWFHTSLEEHYSEGQTMGFLTRIEDGTHLTQWRDPYPKNGNSAIEMVGMTVGIDGRIWMNDMSTDSMVAFKVPDLKEWRSVKPQIVSARRSRGRVAVRIRCVGEYGRRCFGNVQLTRNGRGVGSPRGYAIEARPAGAQPEIIRYLPVPEGERARGLRARISGAASAAVSGR